MDFRFTLNLGSISLVIKRLQCNFLLFRFSRYYYQGCASWKWYFPYHYAPFASDFVNIDSVPTEFEKDTKPFAPLEQLMSVFPAASRSHVPEPWGKLMLEPECPIIDFYPEDFKVSRKTFIPVFPQKKPKSILALIMCCVLGQKGSTLVQVD